jgi:hypothetical protein
MWRFYFHYSVQFYIFILFCAHWQQTAEGQIECSGVLKAQRDESGDSWLEACGVIYGNFVVDVILATVHEVVVLIWTAYQSSGEYVEVWIRAVERVPVTCGRRGWARTAKIFIVYYITLTERPSWFLYALFSPFSFPSYCPFWHRWFPLTNEYFVWRTVHCHR